MEVESPLSVARDEEEKLEAYTLLGVREYALFTPKENAPSTLMGYRREEGDDKDAPMRIWEQDANGRLWSAPLGLHLEVHAQALHARTPDGRLLLMPEQERLARARAELARQRAEEALARAEGERARVEAERARAEAEQRQSADEVERLRRRWSDTSRKGIALLNSLPAPTWRVRRLAPPCPPDAGLTACSPAFAPDDYPIARRFRCSVAMISFTFATASSSLPVWFTTT